MVILDSSVWIAFYLENDIFHYEAVRIVGKHEKRKFQIIIPVFVLIELITVLNRKGVEKDRIMDIIKYVQRTEKYMVYSITENDLIELALKHTSYTKLRTQDYIIYLNCVKLNATVFESFDTKLLKYFEKYKQNHEKQ